MAFDLGTLSRIATPGFIASYFLSAIRDIEPRSKTLLAKPFPTKCFKAAFRIRIRIHPDPLHLSGSGSTSIPALDPDPDLNPLRFLFSDPDLEPDHLTALIKIRVAPKLCRVKVKLNVFVIWEMPFLNFGGNKNKQFNLSDMNFFMKNMKNRYSDPDTLFPNVDPRIRIHFYQMWIPGWTGCYTFLAQHRFMQGITADRQGTICTMYI